MTLSVYGKIFWYVLCAHFEDEALIFVFKVFREDVDTNKLQGEDLGTRFAYYSKRLARLVLSDSVCGDGEMRRVVPDSTVLAVWSQMEHMFPRLRTIHIDGTYLADPTYACRGFGSFLRFRGLQTLQISGHGDLPKVAAEFRHGIVDACSRITALTMTYPSYSHDERGWTTLCSDMLADAHHLCVVDLGHKGVSIHNDSLLSLAKIPVLEHIKIAFETGWAGGVVFPAAAFPSLRILNVRDSTPDARGAISILEHCASSRLEKLELSLECKMVHGCMTMLLHQIGRHGRLIQLSLLSHRVATSSKLIPEFEPFLMQFKPLPLLRTLWLRGHATLPVRVDIVAHVMQLYPRLCQWTLRGMFQSAEGGRTPVTLPFLMEMLRSRPLLVELPVIIDSPDLPSEEAQAAFGIHLHYMPSVKHSTATPALRLAIQKIFSTVNI
jgi:hypothetical protein